MSLSANRNVLLIAPGETSGEVIISWDYPIEIKLFERISSLGSTGQYERHEIFDTELFSGSYAQTLTPGDLYEVGSLDQNFDTTGLNDDVLEKFFEDKVTVVALKEHTDFKLETGERVGGTFYRFDLGIPTSTKVRAILEIGPDEPVADAADFLTMEHPTLTLRSFEPAFSHKLTTDKISGLFDEDKVELLTNASVALITVFDASGDWQQIKREFQTLRRKMTIDFHTMDASSIGEPASETEGEMRFRCDVSDFDGRDWLPVRSFVFENHHTTLAPFSIRNFVTDPVVVIGPRPITEGTPGVALFVREFDPFPFEDETAASPFGLGSGTPTSIKVEPGEDTENDTLELSITAGQGRDPFDPEESLVVHLRYTVKVEHVPA